MPDFPVLQGASSGSTLTMGVVPGNSYGTTLTAAAGANTFGNWILIGNAPTYETGGFILQLTNPSAAGSYAVQLGFGESSGSSGLIVDKVMLQCARANQETYDYYLPLHLPTSGSIMGRVSCTVGASTLAVSIVPFPKSLASIPILGETQSYGFAAGDGAAGTSIEPGATTANIRGAQIQLSPAIANPIRYMIIMVGLQANAVATTALWRLNIAIGPAGQEQIIIPDLELSANTTSDALVPTVFGLPVYVAQGTRLTACAQCTITTASDRLIDVAVLGLN